MCFLNELHVEKEKELADRRRLQAGGKKKKSDAAQIAAQMIDADIEMLEEQTGILLVRAPRTPPAASLICARMRPQTHARRSQPHALKAPLSRLTGRSSRLTARPQHLQHPRPASPHHTAWTSRGPAANAAESIDRLVSRVAQEGHKGLFQGVIVTRYRDVSEEIRLACLQTLGKCVVTQPVEYGTDQCVKYIGWMLNDKHALVRSGALQQLQLIYKTLSSEQVLAGLRTLHSAPNPPNLLCLPSPPPRHLSPGSSRRSSTLSAASSGASSRAFST